MKNYTLLLSFLVLLTIGGRYTFVHISDWLVRSERPQKADLILCLNGNLARVPKVVELFRSGYGDKILVTYPSTGTAMVEAGVPESAILTLDGGYNSTYEEALAAVAFMRSQKTSSVLVVSDPYHLYRARWTYGWLSDAEITMTYVSAQHRTNLFWWHDTTERRTVLREVPKIVYYWIGHGLLGIDSDPQWIVAVEQWYNRMLYRFA